MIFNQKKTEAKYTKIQTTHTTHTFLFIITINSILYALLDK